MLISRKSLGIFALLLAGALFLSACGKSEEPAAAPDAAASIPNPVETVTAEELTDETGLTLNLPQAAADAGFALIRINDTTVIAEADFTYKGKSYIYRAEKMESFTTDDISGLNEAFGDPETITEPIPGTLLYLKNGAGFISWKNETDGVLYNVVMPQGATTEDLTLMADALYAVNNQAEEDTGESPGSSPSAAAAASTENAEDFSEIGYDDLISNVVVGLRSDWGEVSMSTLNISDIFATEPLTSLGFAKVDINGDGLRELCFGTVNSDGSTPIYNLYSADADGNMTEIINGTAHNRFYLCADNSLANVLQEKKGEYTIIYYDFNGKNLVFQYALLYDANSHPDNPWFRNDANIDIESASPISEDAYIAATKGYTPLNYDLFANYI